MRLTRLVGWLVVAAVVYFFSVTIARNWERVREIDFSVSIESILAVLLFALAVVVSGWLWGRVFSTIAHKPVSVLESVRCHLASWVLKYIPGQIGGLIYKIHWSQQQGATKSTGAIAYAYELLFFTLASTLLVIPILIVVTAGAYAGPMVLGYFGLVLAVLLVSQKAPHRLARLAIKRLTKTEPESIEILGIGRILAFSAWFMLPRLINAVGFVILASVMLPVTVDMYLLLGASYVLAGIIGVYALFVPSGIGVREGVIVAFASLVFTIEQAVVLSLVARLYATVADGVIGIAYVCLTRWKNRQPETGTESL